MTNQPTAKDVLDFYYEQEEVVLQDIEAGQLTLKEVKTLFRYLTELTTKVIKDAAVRSKSEPTVSGMETV